MHLLFLTMPGAPFIYYGDEIGMRYVEGLVSKEGGYGRTGADGKACIVIINPSHKKCEVTMEEGQVLHITGKGAE